MECHSMIRVLSVAHLLGQQSDGKNGMSETTYIQHDVES